MPDRRSTQAYGAVVVGAGSAGSAAALLLARAGLRVALLEKRALRQAGARWINGVPSWLLERAGWWPLAEGESLGRPATFHIAGPQGVPRLTVEKPDLHALQVGKLIDRIHRLARQAGVRLLERVGRCVLQIEKGRPVRLRLEGLRLCLEAPLFVDASGLEAVLARQVAAFQYTPLGERDLCHAAQGLYLVSDRRRAEEFCRREKIAPGDSLAWNGVEGPFSTLALRLDQRLERVELLAGAIAGSPRGGPRLLADLRRRLGFVGKKILGGAGLIPLRPAQRFWAPGLALVGDSAGQVFAAHGSGTGAGLLAARALAEACGRAADPGASTALEQYERSWQRELGAAFRAADVFRRQLCRQGENFISRMLQIAQAAPSFMRGGLEQRLVAPPPKEVFALLGALGRRPLAALELGAFVAKGFFRR